MSCTTASGQMWSPDRTETLSDIDIESAFAMGSVVYLYRQKSFASTENAVYDLSDVLTPERASIHGAPAQLDRALAEMLLGTDVQFDLREMIVKDFGDSGFIWRVNWEYGRAQGGSTGVPLQFHGFVNGNGSTPNPERYLCGQFLLEHDQYLYSVLSFEDLHAEYESSSILHGKKILELATDAVEEMLSLQEKPVDYLTYRDQSMHAYPIKTRNSGKTQYSRVWRVNFVRTDENLAHLHDVHPLSVWVTPDGIVSRLEVQQWTAKPSRTK